MQCGDWDRLATAWCQQRHHCWEIRKLFREQNLDTPEQVKQFLHTVNFESIQLAWQLIPMLDNFGDRSTFGMNSTETAIWIAQQDLNDPIMGQRDRGYSIAQLEQSVREQTVDPPTAIYTYDRTKPQLALIDGRTRLRLAYAAHTDITVAAWRP